MGANSKQGWCVFGLLVGFILIAGGGAGLSEGGSGLLSTLALLAGIVLTGASCVGFYQIRPLEDEGGGMGSGQAVASPRAVRAK